MSAKKSTVKYMCSDCGAESAQWMGRCPGCGAWNTMEEFTITEVKKYRRKALSRGFERTRREDAESIPPVRNSSGQ